MPFPGACKQHAHQHFPPQSTHEEIAIGREVHCGALIADRWLCASFGRESDRAIEANAGTVEHDVLDDVLH